MVNRMCFTWRLIIKKPKLIHNRMSRREKFDEEAQSREGVGSFNWLFHRENPACGVSDFGQAPAPTPCLCFLCLSIPLGTSGFLPWTPQMTKVQECEDQELEDAQHSVPGIVR